MDWRAGLTQALATHTQGTEDLESRLESILLLQLNNKQNSVNKKKDQLNELFNRLRKEEVLVGHLEEQAIYLERSAKVVEQDEGTTAAGLHKRNIWAQFERTSKQRKQGETYVRSEIMREKRE